MERAWIAGKAVALDAAIAEAANLIGASRCPLIAGLGTDVAGGRAAIALAERTGAVCDHMHSQRLLRELNVMRSSGMMLTTPGECHVRADTLLVAGPGLGEASLRLLQQVLAKLGVERRVFWLCPGQDAATAVIGGTATTMVGASPSDLAALVAALRAHLADRPVGKARVAGKVLQEVVSGLRAARFGVAIWSAASLDALTLEMLCGLINDLNATTRFSALPLPPDDNALGIQQACAWTTGCSLPTAFGRGSPWHDPWLFDSRRLVKSGETDCVVWISAYRAEAPPWSEAPTTIALSACGTRFAAPPRVHIAVGCPGVDHAGVEHSPSTGSLVAVTASRPSDLISVAEALTRIAAALPRERAC